MKKYLAWFPYLVILFTFVNPLRATENDPPNIYRLIESIGYDHTSSGRTIGIITLSDGTVWEWKPDPFYEDNVDEWAPGDRVSIFRAYKVSYHEYTVGVRNVDKFLSFDDRYVKIKITPDTRQFFTKIVEIDMTDEYMLVLSDGSKWNVNWLNSQYAFYWKVGDLVTVGYQGLLFDSYTLINISEPSRYLTSEISAYFVN